MCVAAREQPLFNLAMVATAVAIVQQALLLALTLSVPIVLAAAAGGLLGGIFTSATQIHDASVSLLPRWLAVLAVLVFAATWGAGAILGFATHLWTALPSLVPG